MSSKILLIFATNFQLINFEVFKNGFPTPTCKVDLRRIFADLLGPFDSIVPNIFDSFIFSMSWAQVYLLKVNA